MEPKYFPVSQLELSMEDIRVNPSPLGDSNEVNAINHLELQIRSAEEDRMNAGYEDIFKYLGDFGRYQKRIYFLLCLPAIACALHKLGSVFLEAQPDYRCRIPASIENGTYEIPDYIKNLTYPWKAKDETWSSCDILEANFTSEYYSKGIPENHSRTCNSWVYDTSTYESSTVTEFNLVCDKSWVPATTDAMFMMGDLVGSVTFGYFSDRFGRRPIFFVSLFCQVVFGIATALMPSAITFLIGRLLIGTTATAAYVTAYVLGQELVGPSKRLFAGMTVAYFFTAGYVLSALFSFLLRNWRHLQIALTAPGILLLSYWWFLPESTRWLLSNGRYEEAKSLLRKAAKENKTEIPEKVLDNLQLIATEKDKRVKKHNLSIRDLVRYPNLRKKSLNLFFNWFVISCTYFGLSWNSSNLGGNDYINFLISGLVELPAPVFLIFTLDRWGRKPLFTVTMLVAAGVLLICNLVPTNLNWLKITLIMIGKCSITASFNVIYIMSAEQFPTVIRNLGMGACSTFARVGGIAAPYVIYLAYAWKPFPEVMFGIMTLFGGILGILLPETLNTKLPDTIEEGEASSKTEKNQA